MKLYDQCSFLNRIIIFLWRKQLFFYERSTCVTLFVQCNTNLCLFQFSCKYACQRKKTRLKLNFRQAGFRWIYLELNNSISFPLSYLLCMFMPLIIYLRFPGQNLPIFFILLTSMCYSKLRYMRDWSKTLVNQLKRTLHQKYDKKVLHDSKENDSTTSSWHTRFMYFALVEPKL